MRNIRIQIEYDGSNYCGWQVQNSRSGSGQKKSIQEVIEKALRKILQERVNLIASGRTDAGVHAKGQVSNFKAKSIIPLKKLQLALNGNLPDDIAVTGVKEEGLDFHSRFQAKSKIYRYLILNSSQRRPIGRQYFYHCYHPLDACLMQREAKVLLGKHNFGAFCASQGKAKNQVKSIKKIKVSRDKDVVTIEIEADGFLYNMVRNIAGTLVEIGRGRIPRGRLKQILASGNRVLAGPTAPACGLCLLKVKY